MENGEGAVGDWRKKLDTYNISNISSNYACEVMLMAELSTDFSEAIELFHHAAQSSSTNVKSLNWDNFMVTTNAIGNSENDEYTSILKSATNEAAKYLNKHIPSELSARLIKLAIIKIIKDYATNERPSCSQKKLPRMSQIMKGKKGVKMETSQKESMTVVGKERLYILINGYYDPHVIIELSKCGIMLSGIIELAYSDTLFQGIDWEQDTFKFPRDAMFKFLNFGHCDGINSYKNPCSELVHIDSNINTKKNTIYHFWKLIYQQLQGELLAECLSNTVHLRITPLYVVAPKKGTRNYERQSLDIFSYISSEILKVMEAKRLHFNYLQSMKINKIDSPPASVAIDTLKSYKRVVDSVPPERATVELLLSGLVEEICTKVPDPARCSSKEFLRASVRSKMARKSKINTIHSAFESQASTSRNESYLSINISHKERQMVSHVSVPIENQASATKSKSKKIRTFHESSLLELGTLCFSHLPPHVHQTCIKSLIYCPVVRSWQQREPLSAAQVLMKDDLLQTLSRHVQLSEEQVRNTMNLALFEMLTCSVKEKSTATKCDVVFCGYIKTEELKIRNTFEAYVSTIELAHIKDECEQQICVNIPYANIDDVPSIYESRNILSYMWYEKLEPIVALQELGQAYRDYACVDQKFCAFTDSMVIRFHNDIDEFGISTKTCNQSIRTRVGLRDFCKYVMQEEALEFESPKHKQKHIQPNEGRFQNNPHSFLGYDYGTSRLQLVGGTTTFHSLDGYKITIDTTTILGQPKKVSLNVTIKGHHFNVHYINKEPIPEKPFMFHFSLADDTIIAFNKPPKVKKEQLIVGEQVNKSKRHKINPHSNIINLRQKRRQRSDGAQSTTHKLRQTLLPTLEDLLKKIEEAKQRQIPLFRILSSKLHKFVYIKRIKSHIDIQVGNNTISLLCKHPQYKVKKVVTKLLRSEINNSKYTTKHYYDVKLSLPSGLLIDTLPRIGNKPFNIKQQYLARVPQSQSVSGECSRSFMRSGHLVIKGCNGDMRILSTNGQIVECKLPHKIEKTSIKYSINRKESTFKGQQNVSLERKTQRLGCHVQKHIIGGKFRRRERNNKSKWPFYGKTKNFKDISNDKILRIRDCDGHEEYFYKRQDGARCLLTANGVLTCEFEDKTRITTWFTIEQEMIRIVDPEGYSWATTSRRPRATSFTVGKLLQAIDMQQDDWVSVNIVYKFEHPKYATIIYSRLDHMAKMLLPNDVIISATKEGFYSTSVDRLISAKITNDNIHLESNLCHSCDHSSVTTINIKPMYENIHPVPEDTLLLQTYDTYNKMFIVDYGGSCYRNSDYIKRRSNRIDCQVHDQQDYQKLYVLNRDLSATKFWNIKAYRKRLAEATSNNDSVVHFNPEIGNSSEKYHSLEIQHYKFKLNNMRFTTSYEYDRLLPSALQKDFIIPQVVYSLKLEIHALSAGTRSQLLQNVVHKLATFQIEFDKASEDVVHHFLRIVCKEFMNIKAHIDLEFAAIDRNVSVPLNLVPKYLEDFRPVAARKVLAPILSTEVKSCGTTYYLPLKQIMICQPDTSDEVVNLTLQHDRDHKIANKSRWDWLGLKKPKNQYIKPGEQKSKVSTVNTFKLKVGCLTNLKIRSQKPQQQAETINKYLDCCMEKTKNVLIQQDKMSLRRKATTTKEQRRIKSKLPSEDQSLAIRVLYDPQQRPKKSEFEEIAAQPSTSYQHKFTAQESISEQTSSQPITDVRQKNPGEQSMDSSSDADDMVALVLLPSRKGWQNSIQ